MLAGFLKSKLFILFSIILFVAFLVGYDYAAVTSGEPSSASSSKVSAMPGKTVSGTADAVSEMNADTTGSIHYGNR
jgi:hypothetical protein